MNEWEAQGWGCTEGMGVDSPRRRRDKDNCGSCFPLEHWHFKKQRGQTEGNTNRKTERGQIDGYKKSVREGERERENETGCPVTVDYFNHAMGLRAKCRR